MILRVIGSGAAQPDGRCQTSFLIEEDLIDSEECGDEQSINNNKKHLLIDCGAGAYYNLTRIGMADRIDYILITHFHMDHCHDIAPIIKGRWLSELSKAQSSNAQYKGDLKEGYPVPTISIAGPPGIKKHIEMIFQLYPYLKDKVILSVYEIEKKEDVSLLEFNGFSIAASEAQHTSSAYSYLITPSVTPFDNMIGDIDNEQNSRKKESGKYSIIITSDTFPCTGTEKLLRIGFNKGLKKALIHELSLPDYTEMGENPTHTRPKDMIEFLLRIPEEIRPEIICFTHIYPALHNDKTAIEDFLVRVNKLPGIERIYFPEDMEIFFF